MPLEKIYERMGEAEIPPVIRYILPGLRRKSSFPTLSSIFDHMT
ncbi:hypothetical protein HMPREF9374_0177 [Desmospora sp. 8437]|nr:hypothetical protein HMPREF9374_0177 [Desmospora sp. 8437]